MLRLVAAQRNRRSWLTVGPLLALIHLLALPLSVRAPRASSKGEVPTVVARQADITYARDIAPIVLTACAPCHRPGEAAPFSLLTFGDVRKRGRVIADVTRSRYMPPWKPEPGFGQSSSDEMGDFWIQVVRTLK